MQPEASKHVECDLRRVTITGTMEGGRLTQRGLTTAIVVSLDGECAGFPDGTHVRVLMERWHAER